MLCNNCGNEMLIVKGEKGYSFQCDFCWAESPIKGDPTEAEWQEHILAQQAGKSHGFCGEPDDQVPP